MSDPVTEYAFCRHGVYLGDANPSRPCPRCIAEREALEVLAEVRELARIWRDREWPSGCNSPTALQCADELEALVTAYAQSESP
jgi:hypothetical protein